MIAEWDTDTLFVSDLLGKQEPDLFAALRSVLVGVPIEIIAGTNDIWCRDFMPVQLDDGFSQFVYDPDYLRDHQHLVTPPEGCRLPFMGDYRQEPIVLDGGNAVASRTKVILTEKVYKENPGIERPRLRARLEEVFKAECIFIPKQAGDDIGHSDGVVRFMDENRVLMNDYSSVDPGYGDRVQKVLEKMGLEVITLPMFEEQDSRRPGEIESAVGIYVNYLRVGNVVVLPGYNRPEDQQAVEAVRGAMPKAVVSQVPCRKLAEKGGVLNCISWTIKMGRERT
jgi:agmatine/peptidylarginine deiminase